MVDADKGRENKKQDLCLKSIFLQSVNEILKLDQTPQLTHNFLGTICYPS